MAISEVAVDHTSAQNIANSDAHTAAGSRRQRGRSRFIKDLVGYVVRSIHSVLGLTAGSVFFSHAISVFTQASATIQTTAYILSRCCGCCR